MGFNFPNSPALNDIYAPVGGPVFTWDGVAWKGTSQGAPVAVYVSDTAPLSPAIGQLWWNSATGTMAIWYADADSAQWVQVSGQVLPTAPSDNGEYVMVNGVWRLVRQSYNLAGVSTQNVTVPAWGPSSARIWTQALNPSNTELILQVSGDGTTYLTGASDYVVGGLLHQSVGGSSAIVAVTCNGFKIVPGVDHAVLSRVSDSTLQLVRAGTSDLLTHQVRGDGFILVATKIVSIFYYGYLNPPIASIKAFRLVAVSGTANTGGRLTVDWLQ